MPRVDSALEDCENHLVASDSFGTRIETLLTYSLLVVIYAEFEQTVNSIVQEKCDLIEDKSLRELVRGCLGNVSRILSGDLGRLLERFGEDQKVAFRTRISANADNKRAETFYNNLIANRHNTAHSSGSILTFEEVKRFYQEGHVVLDFFRETLLSSGTS